MRISKEALKGYLLEEALAYLIKNTGYTLLVDESQDTRELQKRGNGLVVIGRGGEHQVDVLGQLSWIPTFTFPIRLFIEAKFRTTKTGIGVVRSAVGIIEDLNQNFSPMRETGILIKRYNYNYALFSTSGFSKDAIKMAIAHRISLIDLSGPEFADLRNMIEQAADNIIQHYATTEEVAATNDNTIENEDDSLSRNSFITQLRMFIRQQLGTWPSSVIENPHWRGQGEGILLDNFLGELFSFLRHYNELFVGMANGPFLVVLKADNVSEFRSYVREHPTHKVTIHWSAYDNGGRRWYIRPVDYYNRGYQLTFTLPKILGDWIFNSDNPISKAVDAKEKFLSNITIYRSSEDKDELYRLIYSAEDTQRLINNFW